MILIFTLVILLACLLLLKRLQVRKIKLFETPILEKVEILEKYNKERILLIKGVHQGISTNDKSIKKSYWYEMAKQAASYCQEKKNCQILMLGLGANTTTNLIAKLNPKIHQTIVEIDPKVIEAAKEYFSLNELPSYKLINENVYSLKKNQFKNMFNVILVDIFTDVESFVNSKSQSKEFVDVLKNWLKNDGVIIFNHQSNTSQTLDDIKRFKKRLTKDFKKVAAVDINDPRGYRNQIITVFK
jgi:spermidine synthase